MKYTVVCLLAATACCAVAFVAAQPNTPATYNGNGAHQITSADPCADIHVQGWQDVPVSRWTVDPNYDAGVPADYASLWTGQDNLYFYPNGFRKGQVYENNDPPFCFNVYNVQNKQVQVMIQTVDAQARLCIKDASRTSVRMSGTIDRCFTDTTTACFGGLTYPSGALTLVVYTDSTGATTSTPFWYRVRTSLATWDLSGSDRANSAIQTLEMWCMQQDQNTVDMRFPSQLRSVVPPTLSKQAVSAAAAQQGSVVAVLLLACATLVAMMRA